MVIVVKLTDGKNAKIKCKSFRHDEKSNCIRLTRYDGTEILITNEAVKCCYLDEDLSCGEFIE